MVLALGDNHDAAVSIGAGNIIDVSPDADDRFYVIHSGGEDFLAFKTDLEGQGELISLASGS